MNIVQITRIIAVTSVLVLTATGVWAAGADEEPAAAAEKEMVLDPRTGEMVEAPRYGGTLTYATVMPETGTADEAVERSLRSLARPRRAREAIDSELGSACRRMGQEYDQFRHPSLESHGITG